MAPNHVSWLALIVACMALLGGCRDASPEVPEPAYTLVFLKTGPKSGQIPEEENSKLFEGHFANMERMAADGQLLVAGPFGAQRHDKALRGLFVLDTSVRAEAERWAGSDPPTKAGVFTLEFHDLATSAPFRRALEAAMAQRAEQSAQGRTASPGDEARPYVLLTAENFDLAARELAALLNSEGGVYFLGHLDGTRAFALLDAANLEVARERFATPLANMGSHVIDEWFASDQLAQLHDNGVGTH